MKCFLVLIVYLICVESKDPLLTVEAVVGHTAELHCNMTTKEPDAQLSVLVWYKNGTDTAIYSRDFRADVKDVGGGKRRSRYRLVETKNEKFLEMSGVRPEDAGLYYCYADFDNSPAHKTYVHLVVIVPPERLWVVQENGSRVGESVSTANYDLGQLYVGDRLRLYCVAFGGNPRPSLTWWTGGRLLKDASTPLSERRVRSHLAYGPLRREDHGRVLTCRASNNQLVDPLSMDITLDIYLPPELVSVRGDEGPVREGEVIPLQCRVLGARPPPRVVWRLNHGELFNLEQNLTVEASQRLVVSSVELMASREFDEARITCCASAHDRRHTYICADDLTLSVTYPPALEIITDEELDNSTISVVMGSNVTLNCSITANPAVHEYFWYHGEDKLPESGGSTRTVQLRTALELDFVGEDEAGEYKCAAVNAEGETVSQPLIIDVTYPATCSKDKVEEYGLGDESIGIVCEVKSNPPPESYRWVFINGTNVTGTEDCVVLEGSEHVLNYSRPSDVIYGTVLCWGLNGISNMNGSLSNEPCVFVITDETVPRPPTNCQAHRDKQKDIIVSCEEAHNGGLPQKFTLTAITLDSGSDLTSITNVVPKFIVNIESTEAYKLIIVASNAKGDSEVVFINEEDIVDQEIDATNQPVSAVANITTLSLALCGGVALLALLACGLVLCAHERASSADLPRPPSTEPALCAYNTEESNCETWHDSDEGSECNARRAESFRRAVAPRHSPRSPYDVRRSSSFHTKGECRQSRRHTCRVHSLQNINRRREMDVLCDHLAGFLPAEIHYNHHKTPAAYYTMPRKPRHQRKPPKENSDEASEAQNSDGFSLPPPPDEFGSYRAGMRITAKDMLIRSSGPTYAELSQPGPNYAELKNESGRASSRQQYNNVIISPMNTVGLPTVSGAQSGLYTYPDDENQDVNTQRMSTTMSTFQANYPRESGF